MRNILKKYYELDEESKEILPFLYMYQELISSVEDYENVKINNMADEEILMETIIKCWYSTDLDASNIVDRLLEILNGQDITIKDFENLDLEDLNELLLNKESVRDSEIISEFEYKGYYCIFCKSMDKFLLILNEDEHSDVLIFDSMKDALYQLINQHILAKLLNRNYGSNDNSNL